MCLLAATLNIWWVNSSNIPLTVNQPWILTSHTQQGDQYKITIGCDISEWRVLVQSWSTPYTAVQYCSSSLWLVVLIRTVRYKMVHYKTVCYTWYITNSWQRFIVIKWYVLQNGMLQNSMVRKRYIDIMVHYIPVHYTTKWYTIFKNSRI